jgi:integrase
LYRNPLISLSLLNTRTDRRHDRRALSQEEFRRLIEAAETGPPIEGVPGRDRAMLYLLAAWTGLRKSELGSLTPRSFRLDADPPTVKVEAAYSKRRREDVVILHPSIADRVKRYLARGEFASKELLFPICHQSSGLYRKSSKMIQLDLAAARNQLEATGQFCSAVRFKGAALGMGDSFSIVKVEGHWKRSTFPRGKVGSSRLCYLRESP